MTVAVSEWEEKKLEQKKKEREKKKTEAQKAAEKAREQDEKQMRIAAAIEAWEKEKIALARERREKKRMEKQTKIEKAQEKLTKREEAEVVSWRWLDLDVRCHPHLNRIRGGVILCLRVFDLFKLRRDLGEKRQIAHNY